MRRQIATMGACLAMAGTWLAAGQASAAAAARAQASASAADRPQQPAATAAHAQPASAAPAALPTLDVERGADAIIRTTDGRQALMRGVNVNQLGDYYAVRPDLPTTIPLRRTDFTQIAAVGFDHVRLVLSWSALEPTRGTLSPAYLDRIRQAVGWARAAGLHVVLDMHQDAWGKSIASEGEHCLPGLSPAQGWDGAPAWATFTDGLPRCRVQIRELAPAVAQAWTSFLVDRAGIRTALAVTWGKLARAFAADPTVAGYDLLNEPHPGYLVGAAGPTGLAAFYTDAITRIRAAEAAAPGGFHHLVFFEPTVLWSATAVDTTPLPGFTADRRIVFAPHLYAESITVDQTFGAPFLTVEAGFATARAFAASYRAPLWSGEWGWFGEPAKDLPKLERYGREEDRLRVGGALWQWRQACGDPHNYTLPSRQPTPIARSLNPYACPEGRALPVPLATRTVIARARPRYAPGRLTQLTSDGFAGTMALAGRDADPAGSCVLDVWVPGAARPVVTADGVAGLRRTRVRGGWRVTGCARGTYALRTRIPATPRP